MTVIRLARPASIGLAVVAVWLLLADPVAASDCQEPSDCFGSTAAGLAALLGFLSFTLNFVPIIGDAKGIFEGIIGRDLFTGRRLSASERLIGAIAIIPGTDVFRLFRGADGLTGLRAVDDIVPPPRTDLPVRPDTPPARAEPPPRDYAPGTPEHREARWRAYQERGGQWPRERWDRQYDINLNQARRGNEVADRYREQLGLPESMREQTVSAGGEARRLDIVNRAEMTGYEVKSGDYTTQSPFIRSEIRRDAILVEDGWDITWAFEGRPSQPLLDALAEAGIRVDYIR